MIPGGGPSRTETIPTRVSVHLPGTGEGSGLTERPAECLRQLRLLEILVLRQSESESLQIDLESLRTLLQGKFGLGTDFEITGSLPIYWMHGGFLDPFISGFHDAFNLPNRIRGAEPNNLFRYEWRVQDTPILEREDGFVAFGDLTLQVKRAIIWKELGATELAARAAIKLPTGSRDSLVSSGGTDLGFGVELSRVRPKGGGLLQSELPRHLGSRRRPLQEFLLMDGRRRLAFSNQGSLPCCSMINFSPSSKATSRSCVKAAARLYSGCGGDDRIASSSSGALPKTSLPPLPISL